jgi:hypothetical protein
MINKSRMGVLMGDVSVCEEAFGGDVNDVYASMASRAHMVEEDDG